MTNSRNSIVLNLTFHEIRLREGKFSVVNLIFPLSFYSYINSKMFIINIDLYLYLFKNGMLLMNKIELI